MHGVRYGVVVAGVVMGKGASRTAAQVAARAYRRMGLPGVRVVRLVPRGQCGCGCGNPRGHCAVVAMVAHGCPHGQGL